MSVIFPEISHVKLYTLSTVNPAAVYFTPSLALSATSFILLSSIVAETGVSARVQLGKDDTSVPFGTSVKLPLTIISGPSVANSGFSNMSLPMYDLFSFK